MSQARDIAHRYMRRARACDFNRHSDRHQEHSQACNDLCTEIERVVAEARREAASSALVEMP